MIVVACLFAACGVADSGQSLGPETRTGFPAPAPEVLLTPSYVSLEEEEMDQVLFEVTSAQGEVKEEGEWMIEDPSVAWLAGGGAARYVEGIAQGSTSVVAAVDGVADTATVVVTEATTTSSSGGQKFVFDPDRYSSTQELEDDPYGVFYSAEVGGNYHLDTEVGYPGGSKSMRYDFVDQGNTAISIGRNMLIPDGEPTREIWVEAYVRWSANFFAETDPDHGIAHKLIFGNIQAPATDPPWETSEGCPVSRWSLLFPIGGSANPSSARPGAGTPIREASKDGDCSHRGDEWPDSNQTQYASATVGDYFDGQWHQIRLHWRHDPGLYELWIDGVKVYETTVDWDVHSEAEITNLGLGRNKDMGNLDGSTESLWWGKVTIWTGSSGW